MTKIKIDFTTNSSSTSFICIQLKNRDLEEKVLLENNMSYETIEEKWEDSYDEEIELKGNLVAVLGESGDVYYIGKNINEIEQYPFIKGYMQMIKAVLKDDVEWDIKSIEDLNEYFISNYCWGKNNTLDKIFKEEPEVKDLYDKYKEKLENEYNIIIKSVDNNDEGVSKIIFDLHDGINFIIEGE
jgi:hypothetical protein